MEPQPQAVRPNEDEQTATSTTTAALQPQAALSASPEQSETTAAPVEQQPQAASSDIAEQAGANAPTVEQQPGAASSAEADQVHAIADITQSGWMNKLLSFLIWALVILGVIALWLALLGWEISSTAFDWSDLTKLGLLGDSFGTLNTLFSGLAFLGIIISIKLQRDDLKLQREELAMQRKEITFQRKAIEIQAQEAQHQSEEMQSQRKLAQEYQDERFFVLLLDQIKGYAVLNRFDEIRTTIYLCYTERSIRALSDNSKTYLSQIKGLITARYIDINDNNQEPVHRSIAIFLDNIAGINVDFQLLFDRATQLYEFIMSLSDEKIRTNYARIAYNNIGQYDRIILFMFLVAKLHLRKGDILGDLLFVDYEKLGDI